MTLVSFLIVIHFIYASLPSALQPSRLFVYSSPGEVTFDFSVIVLHIKYNFKAQQTTLCIVCLIAYHLNLNLLTNVNSIEVIRRLYIVRLSSWVTLLNSYSVFLHKAYINIFKKISKQSFTRWDGKIICLCTLHIFMFILSHHLIFSLPFLAKNILFK